MKEKCQNSQTRDKIYLQLSLTFINVFRDSHVEDNGNRELFIFQKDFNTFVITEIEGYSLHTYF